VKDTLNILESRKIIARFYYAAHYRTKEEYLAAFTDLELLQTEETLPSFSVNTKYNGNYSAFFKFMKK
jgi:hypothetical protein